ncbi:MAG: hypothetical protein O7H39_11160 [Gammaproteobacteria bacterium]|nr:hypothetical protein [Gammaproteobacteria bacterium]
MNEQNSSERTLRSELEALPHLDAPASVWERVQERLDAIPITSGGVTQREAEAPVRWLPRVSRWLPDKPLLAVAAGAFLAAVATVLWLAPSPASEMNRLMARSQQLETRIHAIRTHGARNAAGTQREWGSDTSRALAFRIADVDASLSRISMAPAQSGTQQRRRLWRRRVDLMESLVRLEQHEYPSGQPRVRPVAY